MKANIMYYDLEIRGLEVSAITEYHFSVKVPTDYSSILITLLANRGVHISFYSTFISILFDRKDITSFELYHEED
jgi:hypothetical protein